MRTYTEPRWQSKLQLVTQLIVMAALFSLPLSTTVTDLLFLLAGIVSLFSWRLQEHWEPLKSNPVAITLVAFFLLYVIGSTYSIAPAHDIIHQLLKAACFLCAALLMPTLLDERWRRYAINAFLLAIVITLLLSYVKYFWIPDLFHTRFYDASVFKDHIIQNFLLAYALFIFIFRWLNKYPHRWLYVILSVLTLFNVIFISTGRSGYFIFAALLIYTLWTPLKWKGVGIALVTIAVLFSTAYWTSHSFKDRMSSTVDNTVRYQQGEQYSSVGIRLQSMKNAAILFKEKPLIGHGTGSFLTAYKSLPATSRSNGILPVSYNDYLNIGVELGIPGIALLLFMFYTQWRTSYRLSSEYRFIIQTLVISMVIGCLANPWLSDTTELHLYALLLAVGFAALPAQRQAIKIAQHVAAE